MLNGNGQAFINDVSSTIDALRELSGGIARYLTENEAGLDESQRSDLKDSVGALTIQITALKDCLVPNDLDLTAKAKLLESAKSSVAEATQFLNVATSEN
jgi:hypothetical protein